MKTLRFLFLCLFFCARAFGQIPPMISYQVRLTVGTTNFDGTGQFKFALVNGATGVNLWTNDGTNLGSTSEPTAGILLPVAKGLSTVLLGNTAIAGMTSVPESVFTNSDVRVRTWFNAGAQGWQRLSPDYRISSVGYAYTAGIANTVPDGAITTQKIAPGAVTADKLAAGAGVPSGGIVSSESYLDPALIAAGFVPYGGPMTSGDVWTKRGIVGSLPGRGDARSVWTNSELVFFGGATSSNLGGKWNAHTDTWSALPTENAPSPRFYHTMTWTGTEVIVWGGEHGGIYRGDGGRYNPVTGIWRPISTVNAPAGRSYHTAVWTGSKLLIWGGWRNGAIVDDANRIGAAYDPVTDEWTNIPLPPSPISVLGRYFHSAVWTGSKMIIFGGIDSSPVDTGLIYDPLSATWSGTSVVGAPASRYGHSAVWTGAEMLVFGGNRGNQNFPNDGAFYNPITNTWRPIPTPDYNLVNPTYKHGAIWTGREMAIWGGDSGGASFNTGAFYSASSNSWSVTPVALAPPAATYLSVNWTGREMLILGPDGFIYGYAPKRTLYNYRKP